MDRSGSRGPGSRLSFKHPSPTTGERAGKVRLAPVLGDDARPDTGTSRSLPRHLAPSQRRPGLIRSLLSAFLLVVVVLAVGAVVILSSINRVENRPDSVSPQSPPAQQPVKPAAPARSEPLLREGSFESGSTGAVRNQRGSTVELVAGVGAESAHSVRLSNVGPPFGRAGLLVDRVARPPRLGSRYNASVQVKGARGQLVQIRLVESFGGQRVSATPTVVELADTGWREVSVQHQIRTDGSILGVEVTVSGVSPGQFVWVDNLQVTQTR
jgi:hypothetical protein